MCKKGLLDAAVTNRGYYWEENKHLYRPVLSQGPNEHLCYSPVLSQVPDEHLCRPMLSHVPLKTTNYSSKLDSMSGHIIVNTDDKERDRKFSNGMESLGHCYRQSEHWLWNWHGCCLMVSGWRFEDYNYNSDLKLTSCGVQLKIWRL